MICHLDGKVDYQAWQHGEFTKWEYNGRGMIESIQHKKTAAGPDLAYRRYWRDGRDRIEAWKRGTDTSQNWMEDGRGDRYHYDAEGQLDRASYRVVNPESSPGPALRTDMFTYDEMGNRVRWNHIASRGWMDLKRRDNGLNQYREWENNIPAPDPNHWGSGIFHDDNIPPNPSPPSHPFVPPGNGVLMQDGYITGGFNALNQPVAIWSFAYWNTPNWMFFGYDPLGRCVKRWVGSSGSPATYFYYDGWNLIQEGPGGGTVDRVYVHGGRVDEIVASQAGGQWVYHRYDARGHCILLTNPSGNILEQYDYDAFGQPYFYSSTGQPLNSSTFGNRFLFTGREWIKDLKLYDYRNRMYQPELGRFLQPDPKQFEAGDYNLYRYCHNDPVNNSDPDGLQRRTVLTPRQVEQMRREALRGVRAPQGAPRDISGNRYLPDGRIIPPEIRAAPRNPHGSPGKPDHRSVVDKLGDLFRRMFSGRDVEVRTNTSIRSETGVNRRPDVSAIERDRVIMVGEVARLNQNGTMVPRESIKRAEYDAANVPSIFIGIPPNN